MGAADGTVGASALLLDKGLASARFNVVLLAEGFLNEELPVFHDRCDALVQGLLARAPFDAIDVESALNVWRLDIASAETGVDDPVDCGGTGFEANTYFDASLCDGGVARIMSFAAQLAIDTMKAPAVVQQIPQWNVLLIIANDAKFGGTSVGEVSIVTTHATWIDAAVHELGHAAFGLADEYNYWAGCDSNETDHNVYSSMEPIEPNVTASASPMAVKWSNFVQVGTPVPIMTNPNCGICNPASSPFPPGTVGAFEGAYYFHCGAFRPEFSCRMRYNLDPFCAVCQAHIRTALYSFQSFATSPHEFAEGIEPWPATLQWTSGTYESGWEVQISEDAHFIIDVLTPSASPLTAQNGDKLGTATVWLKPKATYYWRVRKANLAPGMGWTTARAFTTMAKKPAAIKPNTNSDTGPVHPWDLTFSWSKVDGAGQYMIEISDDNFASTIFPPVYTTLLEEPLSIKVATDHLWRVTAIAKEGGPDNAGEPSDPVAVKTTPVEVVAEHPDDNKAVHPWPVTLGWKSVKGADYYIVEMSYDEAHFGPESLKMLKELGVEPIVNHPIHHLTFNMRPRWLSDNDQRFWHVRVIGPPPLSEEGTPSDPRSFVNHGDLTVAGHYVQIDPDPGQTWGRWSAHKEEGASVYWDATMKWGHVDAATEYDLTLRAWAQTSGPPADAALNLPITVTDDNDHNWEIYIRTDEDNVDPLPGVGLVAYSWDVIAIGPEGIPGLLKPSTIPDLIEPDEPTVIAPAHNATGVLPSGLVLSFASQYTPSGKYRVQLEGLLPGGVLHETTIGGNPGGETNFDLTAFGLAKTDLQAEQLYNWRVRAVADEPVVDATYAWGPTWTFTTAPAPPQMVQFYEEHCAELPEVYIRLFPVADATHYDFEYQPIPAGADLDAPGTSVMTKTWLTDDLAQNTSTYEALTGVTLPNGQAALPLPGTTCLGLYRLRVRLCKSANCSEFTEWGVAGLPE
jgi:hypothetical protein